MKLPWSVTAPARNIHIVDLVAKSATDHWWFLLSGDRHHDNPHADHELEKKHLDEVVKRKAGWIDVGDLFCAMEGRADPRRSRKGVREEHAMAPDYFDSIVNAAAEFYKPYAQHCVVIGRGNHECLDESSQVLTRRGWIPVSEVTMDDEVASMHQHDLTTVWAKPLKTHRYKYSGEMVEIRQRGMSMRVTPNHRIAYYTGGAFSGTGNQPRLAYAEADKAVLMSSLRIPATATSIETGCQWSDDQIRLAAWILTDGSIGKDSASVYIYQSKQHGIEKIRSILTSLGLTFSETVRPGRCDGIIIKSALPQHVFRINRTAWMKELVGGKIKSIPEWVQRCDDRQFAIFLESYVDGDGSRRPKQDNSDAMVIYGTEHVLSGLQACCVTHGYRASLSWQKREDHGYWRLNVTRRRMMTVSRGAATKTKHDGYVYCLTTVTGNLFVRRDGCAYVTGNSSVLKNNETDLTERLCERMSMMSKCKVYPGGYGGWIKFRTDRGSHRYALNLKYFHGSGGAALMSFDTLKVRRQAAVMPDADVIVQGHVHKQWVMPLARERLISDKAGMRIRHDVQYHVRVGTYKDEFQDGYGGFHVEQGRTPEIIGAIWMKLSLHHEIVNGETRYSLRPEFFPIH